jgi:hypothetical protein
MPANDCGGGIHPVAPVGRSYAELDHKIKTDKVRELLLVTHMQAFYDP